MIKRLFMLRHRILSYWRPNRAANPSIQDMIPMVFTRINHLWSGRRATGWYLNYLAVHPAHQNQSFGRVLATWGVKRAKDENVAASVISALGKDRFYRRCGFEILGGRVSDGEDNPMKGKTEGGSVLFCDPMDE
jgi:GNAT superfamily N-acetyltransferase